ncbi:MAG: S9 family peptidase [Planctomycetota bacterium]
MSSFSRLSPVAACRSAVAAVAITLGFQSSIPLHADEIPQYTIEQFLKTTGFRGASFSPDKKRILLSSDESGVFNAYAIDVATGKREALTDSKEESILTIGYFPEDERFLYSADQGGNELNHVYVRMPDGSVKDLTPGDNLKAQFAGWSKDDRYFYVASNKRDQRYFDLYRFSIASLSEELIFQNDEGYVPGSVSPDGRFIALNKVETRDNSNVFLYDVDSKSTRLLTEHEGDINYGAADFSPDGEHLLMTTDRDSEFLYLVQQNLESGERETVLQTDWDVVGAGYSKHGRFLGIAINEDAKTTYKLFETEGMKSVELPAIEGASLASLTIADSEDRIAMYATSGKMPRDLFYFELSSDEPVQLTQSLNADIQPEHLVDGEVIRFDSFDGVKIPGILYKPQQANEKNQVPALLWVHGGPGGQSTLGYRALIQYMVNHGYCVYAINNRGSSGYGKTFQQMDDQKHGEGDLDDCVASKKMLIATGFVDPDRIGILGGSYGGYMVCAALAFRPDEFEVGVNLFGVTNWVRTLGSIPPWWEAQRKALEKEMGDFNDTEYLTKISPLFHTKNITKPLIVLQGANDPRVLKVESDEIVAAVKANGVPVRYEVFDDEGHGFRKKANQLRGYHAILEFCDRHLKRD